MVRRCYLYIFMLIWNSLHLSPPHDQPPLRFQAVRRLSYGTYHINPLYLNTCPHISASCAANEAIEINFLVLRLIFVVDEQQKIKVRLPTRDLQELEQLVLAAVAVQC